ncbi:MAG: hypothetical protein WAW52_04860 [Methanothrix sp.]
MKKLPLQKVSDGIYTLPKSFRLKIKLYISSNDEELKIKLSDIFNVIKMPNDRIRREYFCNEYLDEELEIKNKLEECSHFISILSGNSMIESNDGENSSVPWLMNIELEIATQFVERILYFASKDIIPEKITTELTFKRKAFNPIIYIDIKDLAAKILSEIYIDNMMHEGDLSDTEESGLGLFKYLINNFYSLKPIMRDELLMSLSEMESIAPGIAQILSVYFDLINSEVRERLMNNLLRYKSASKFLPWILAEDHGQISEELRNKLLSRLIGEIE